VDLLDFSVLMGHAMNILTRRPNGGPRPPSPLMGRTAFRRAWSGVSIIIN
jgi:hypothetical protein